MNKFNKVVPEPMEHQARMAEMGYLEHLVKTVSMEQTVCIHADHELLKWH